MERKNNYAKDTVCTAGTEDALTFEELKNLHERKLTQEEPDFSAEHLSVVWWFLNEYKLPAADWFDVVIFRYLLTVKRWFTLPSLHKYSFTTLATAAMKSAVNAERRKQARRPQTLSLDAPCRGTYGKPLAEYLAA